MNVLSGQGLRWSLNAALLLLLSACVGGASSQDVEKVGMHIDAVLEFVIEYPLDWVKDRRLAFGSTEGEVRWTGPGPTLARLRVISNRRRQHTDVTEQTVVDALADQPGLVVATKEKVVIAAGEAWLLTGQTGIEDLTAYLFFDKQRVYRIILTTPQGTMADYEEILERVSDSFAPLRGPD